MSAVDLQAGHDWITRKFYHPWRITRRLWHHVRRPRGLLSMPWVTTLNLGYYERVKRWKLAGYNPEKSIERCLGSEKFHNEKGAIMMVTICVLGVIYGVWIRFIRKPQENLK